MAGYLGCECLDADRVAKSLWERPDIKAQAVSRWGEEILDPSGKINTAETALRTFSAKSEHDFCNSLLHPAVMSELHGQVHGASVLEIPLLPETGRPEWIDRAIYVTAKFEARAERCKLRGWDSEELRRREKFLLPQNERIAVCDYIVYNDGGISDLYRQLEEAKF